MTPGPELHPAVVVCAVAVAFGAVASIYQRPPPRPERAAVLQPETDDAPADDDAGLFHEARRPDASDSTEALLSIGYLAGSREATDLTGIVTHDPEQAWQGLNLYTSGHAAEAVLMDMEGEILHTWRLDYEDVWPGRKAKGTDPHRGFWRRAHLYPNGDLLAIFEGIALVKVDRNSELLWAQANQAHHDLEVLSSGEILVLTRRRTPRKEMFAQPAIEDLVSVLGPDGFERARRSVLDATLAVRPASLSLEDGGDVLHTNSLERIPEGHPGANPPFLPGRILLSMREIHLVALLDMGTGQLVWSRRGPWRLQHDPTLLDNGHILLFDNGLPEDARSRVVELSPPSMDEVWSWEGTAADPLWSATCGTAQRLPNGNTLVTESDNGRAVEVTGDGQVVWEFRSPHRPAEHPELVATLFENVRLPDDFPVGWAHGPAPP